MDWACPGLYRSSKMDSAALQAVFLTALPNQELFPVLWVVVGLLINKNHESRRHPPYGFLNRDSLDFNLYYD
jgi:hypothetical protein